jgi:hypothetical protein
MGQRGHDKIVIFSMEKEKKINWDQDFFVHHRIISAVTE